MRHCVLGSSRGETINKQTLRSFYRKFAGMAPQEVEFYDRELRGVQPERLDPEEQRMQLSLMEGTKH